ncbi:MAG: DUF4224 domain-containing protein [Legionellales bacterium]|nr:DUF4224 domain-containing protein [Legionellales bacterium]
MMFLSKSELQELTGYKYCKKQIEWLRLRGYKHEIGADGKPKVLTAYVTEILGVSNTRNEPYRKRSIPDFDALLN